MPSRTDVPEYAEYLEKIEALVAVVNHRHGTPDWMPIDLKLRDDLDEAVASYKHYDVMMVNAMFDGMNLVAKEGPLVNERDGVSILSENTGAHEELGEFALSVNPFDVQELADAIYSALTMAPRRARAPARAGLKEIVTSRDPGDWIDEQIADIRKQGARRGGRGVEVAAADSTAELGRRTGGRRPASATRAWAADAGGAVPRADSPAARRGVRRAPAPSGARRRRGAPVRAARARPGPPRVSRPARVAPRRAAARRRRAPRARASAAAAPRAAPSRAPGSPPRARRTRRPRRARPAAGRVAVGAARRERARARRRPAARGGGGARSRGQADDERRATTSGAPPARRDVAPPHPPPGRLHARDRRRGPRPVRPLVASIAPPHGTEPPIYDLILLLDTADRRRAPRQIVANVETLIDRHGELVGRHDWGVRADRLRGAQAGRRRLPPDPVPRPGASCSSSSTTT